MSDRLPRHLVLVAAAVVQGLVQAVSGVLVLTGHATIGLLAGLAIVYGLADGFVIPASQGLIPLIVSTVRLQQANALLGLSRSILGFAAPALGGVLVPLGAALAGPVASLIGIHTTLIACGTISFVCIAIIVAQPSVWAIGDGSRADPVAAT